MFHVILMSGGLNCAYFIAGIVEKILFGCNFVSMKIYEKI